MLPVTEPGITYPTKVEVLLIIIASCPPMVKEVMLFKFDPFIVTSVPIGPDVGENETMVGTWAITF